MSDTAHHSTHHPNYIQIWAILCVLLLVSIVGPMLEIRIVTLITAFGIAIVKAYLVARNFMHLNVQPKFVVYMLATVLAFMLLFFAGVAPDVMKAEGSGWTKPSYDYYHTLPSEPHGKGEGAAGENH